MNLSTRKNGVFMALGASLLLSNLTHAGVADVVNSDGSTMKFEYQDDKLRIDTGQGEASYMVLRDDHIYVVTNSDGNLMVIDANQAMGMFGSMAGAATPSSVASEVVSLEATGRKESHAGITGEVYNMVFVTEDGKKQQTDLVLAKDARARDFSKALSGMAMSLSKSAGKDFARAANDMESRLLAMDMGVLRYGKDMTISAISDEAVDQSRFELPAEPTDLSSIGSLMNQSSQSGASDQTQKSGGVVSSFLGALSKGSSNKDNSNESDKEQEEGQESQEKSEDNPLGKAFGKLFGK
ncbi:MAG: hypothetical protein V7700_15070 [Halioglobus sp.]